MHSKQQQNFDEIRQFSASMFAPGRDSTATSPLIPQTYPVYAAPLHLGVPAQGHLGYPSIPYFPPIAPMVQQQQPLVPRFSSPVPAAFNSPQSSNAMPSPALAPSNTLRGGNVGPLPQGGVPSNPHMLPGYAVNKFTPYQVPFGRIAFTPEPPKMITPPPSMHVFGANRRFHQLHGQLYPVMKTEEPKMFRSAETWNVNNSVVGKFPQPQQVHTRIPSGLKARSVSRSKTPLSANSESGDDQVDHGSSYLAKATTEAQPKPTMEISFPTECVHNISDSQITELANILDKIFVLEEAQPKETTTLPPPEAECIAKKDPAKKLNDETKGGDLSKADAPKDNNTEEKEKQPKVRKYGFRSKQNLINKVYANLQAKYTDLGILVGEDEVLRGEDTIRVHVKKFKALQKIEAALESIESEGIVIKRISTPLSMKNQFQKKGFLVYLKLEDINDIPLARKIFQSYEEFQKCDVARINARQVGTPPKSKAGNSSDSKATTESNPEQSETAPPQAGTAPISVSFLDDAKNVLDIFPMPLESMTPSLFMGGS